MCEDQIPISCPQSGLDEQIAKRFPSLDVAKKQADRPCIWHWQFGQAEQPDIQVRQRGFYLGRRHAYVTLARESPSGDELGTKRPAFHVFEKLSGVIDAGRPAIIELERALRRLRRSVHADGPALADHQRRFRGVRSWPRHVL